MEFSFTANLPQPYLNFLQPANVAYGEPNSAVRCTGGAPLRPERREDEGCGSLGYDYE